MLRGTGGWDSEDRTEAEKATVVHILAPLSRPSLQIPPVPMTAVNRVPDRNVKRARCTFVPNIWRAPPPHVSQRFCAGSSYATSALVPLEARDVTESLGIFKN